jgi:hypothetical protein
MNRSLTLVTMVVLTGSSLLSLPPRVHAMSPASRQSLSGSIAVKFSLRGPEHGAATFTHAYDVVRPPEEFSGCGIKTTPILHSRELIVQVYPRSLADQLQRRVKLTITLTSSGGVSALPIPTLSLTWKGRTYVNLTGNPKVTLSAGGLSGSFDIPQLRDVSAGVANVEARGSWHCSSLLHFTEK